MLIICLNYLLDWFRFKHVGLSGVPSCDSVDKCTVVQVHISNVHASMLCTFNFWRTCIVYRCCYYRYYCTQYMLYLVQLS